MVKDVLGLGGGGRPGRGDQFADELIHRVLAEPAGALHVRGSPAT
jgi:hypothetical protein